MKTSAQVLTEFDKVVNAMTNWETHQWAKAGYPGLVGNEVDKVRPFLKRKRPKKK